MTVRAVARVAESKYILDAFIGFFLTNFASIIQEQSDDQSKEKGRIQLVRDEEANRISSGDDGWSSGCR